MSLCNPRVIIFVVIQCSMMTDNSLVIRSCSPTLTHLATLDGHLRVLDGAFHGDSARLLRVCCNGDIKMKCDRSHWRSLALEASSRSLCHSSSFLLYLEQSSD